ncbi:DUF1569 domain-containing protein [Flavicella sediminum]|uniref:DUF1569 domain-containing protein n=1 Tax=Flavicella sediminum TaxID=2585141 RepID=UPI00111CB752|nr:DUF1569 domain-containing protein [Flavicella sediminum]
MESIFDNNVAHKLIDRINSLSHDCMPIWGKMNVAQMLAHSSVMFDLAYNEHEKPNKVKQFLLKQFVKPIVVGKKPYKTNSRTAPEFIISEERVFEVEKEILIDYIKKTQQLGADYFEGKESNSFGKLTANEWDISFYKHLDHHLRQFAV